ncbi:RDD family protein [Streptomyces sp. URMC 126]|uniref:RDD family protein n=1 Tax=Streptomyces sp. URMC 126 TaxID=3423401 RepID=UPI003F1AD601
MQGPGQGGPEQGGQGLSPYAGWTPQEQPPQAQQPQAQSQAQRRPQPQPQAQPSHQHQAQPHHQPQHAQQPIHSATPQRPAQAQAQSLPVQQTAAASQPPPAAPQPAPASPAQPLPAQQAVPDRQAAPGPEQAAPAPWKPPTENPFLLAARQEGRPAGLGRRLAARLIDTAVLGGAVAAVALPLWTKAVGHIDEKVDRAKRSGETVTVWLLDGTTGTYLAVVLAALLLGGVLYEVLPTSAWGRTLGKKLCGVRVLDIESHDTPRFRAALRRWLVYSLLGVVAVGVLNALWCLFDRPWRQCWHDKAARTFVASGRG